MRNRLAFVALLGLAACEEGPSPEEQALQDARDVAMVKAANKVMPPIKEVTPEPILLPDIERHDLYGMACNYAPGTSLGTRVVAREADAFVKVEGEVHRFAADPGSRELPMRTRTLYNGREFTLRLAINADGDAAAVADGEAAVGAGAATAAPGTRSYEGTVELRDRWGRVVYEGTGLAQCKG